MSARPSPGRPPARQRSAFTLIELVLGLAISAVLMGAMVASIAIASRGIDPGTSPTGRAVEAAGVLEQLDADLALAESFAERTPSAVTFTVPDRDGDGSAEVIRYAWLGLADGRLTRQINSGPAATVADDVRAFSLSYLLRTIDPNSEAAQGDGGGGSGGDDGDDGGGPGRRGRGKRRGQGWEDRDDHGKGRRNRDGDGGRRGGNGRDDPGDNGNHNGRDRNNGNGGNAGGGGNGNGSGNGNGNGNGNGPKNK